MNRYSRQEFISAVDRDEVSGGVACCGIGPDCPEEMYIDEQDDYIAELAREHGITVTAMQRQILGMLPDETIKKFMFDMIKNDGYDDAMQMIRESGCFNAPSEGWSGSLINGITRAEVCEQWGITAEELPEYLEAYEDGGNEASEVAYRSGKFQDYYRD